MSFSRGGSSTTSTANQTENVSAPLNQQDTQGIAIGSAGGSVTIQQLDAGAIQNATD